MSSAASEGRGNLGIMPRTVNFALGRETLRHDGKETFDEREKE